MTDPPFRLEFTPSAMRDLEEISDWIAETSGYPERALAYVERVERFCQSLVLFPERSPRFDNIAAGLRMTGFERRATIAYLVDVNAKRVVIIGVFARGRDVGAALRNRIAD